MNKKKLIKLLIYVVSFLLAALLFYKAFVPLAPSLWEAIKSGDEAEIEAFLAQRTSRTVPNASSAKDRARFRRW